MVSTLEQALLAATLILNGLLAGAGLEKAIIQLPAGRKIGLRAMAEYHRATDLGLGLFSRPWGWAHRCSHGRRQRLSSRGEMSPVVRWPGLEWQPSSQSVTSSRR